MGILYAHPLFRRPVNDGFDLIVGRGTLSLLHDTEIDLILQNAPHGRGRPPGFIVDTIAGLILHAPAPLVLHRRGDAQGVEFIGDGLAAHAGDPPGKNLPHHVGGLGIHHQSVFIFRIFGITVGGEGADELSVAPLDVKMAAYLDGRVPAVGVVDQIFEGQDQAAGGVQIGGIITVVDGDKAHAQGWEQFFNIPARLDVFPAKAGEVFDNDTVDLLFFDRLQHLLEIGPLEVGAGVAVIIALHHQLQLRVLSDIAVDQIPLVFDAVALYFIAVLFREPAVGIAIKKLHENTS